MGPGWVRWTVTWWESANGSELGASDGLFQVNLQMNPGLAKWILFWSRNILGGTRLGELDRVLHVKSGRR